MQSTMVRSGVVALAMCAGGSVMAQSAVQAPATAQAWDVQFRIETVGPSGTTLQETIPRFGPQLLDATTTGSVLTRLGTGGATIAVPASPTRWVDEVRITMLARVAIRTPTPGGPTWNTRNFGVSRVGGANGSFFATVTDGYTKATGQGVIQRAVVPGGVSSEDGNPVVSTDVNGNALAGTHWAFRQGFTPPGTGGSNTDPQNGLINNQTLPDGSNRSSITSLIQTRAVGYDGRPLGAATITGFDAFGVPILAGEYAEVYSFVYKPKLAAQDDYSTAVRGKTRDAATFPTLNDQIIEDIWTTEGAETNRRIQVQLDGISARYLYNVVDPASQVGVPDGTAQGSTNFNIPTIRFDFRVPTPGTAATLGLAGLAALRRRRR